MTELERHLLNALEQLQQDYMQRLNEWENAFVELQKMFSLTQRDNAFAKKYTSGVLSFAEKELPPGGREKVMASFERVLMPGLEKNQYSILWVEHQDKGRLELNFVIPNMELQTGKRLQPYYDRADRPRIDAWQTLVNHHYGLHDPNAPENRRTLTLQIGRASCRERV